MDSHSCLPIESIYKKQTIIFMDFVLTYTKENAGPPDINNMPHGQSLLPTINYAVRSTPYMFLYF